MSASRTGETGPQRHTPLPGISSTASALRTRRAEARGQSYPADPCDLDDFEVETPGDAALNELPSGIIMPGIKGSRAPQRQPPSKSGTDGSAPPNRPKPLVAPLGALRKGRNAPPKLPAGAGPSRPSLQLKGTPARVPRYSLPVRAEKPVRTSKVSGRHVMLPSESQLAPLPLPEHREAVDEGSAARLSRRMEQRSDPVYHTFEHMTPQVRVQTRLPRLTSYAISAALHLPTLLAFLRREHDVRPRLYEGCAYVLYFKPLLPGFGRATVRSSKEPQTGSPGASSRHERELQRHEESGYVGDYFVPQEEEDIDTDGYIPNELREGDVDLRHAAQAMTSPGLQDADSAGAHDMLHAELEERQLAEAPMPVVHINEASHTHECEENEHAPRAIRDALNMAELIVLPYGVVVMFNFTQDEEESMIKDIMASGSVRNPHKTYDRELFQFCYDPHVPAPRINNDFFTFRAPNHLLKLSLAHAIAQSTKLSEFEENMHKTLEMASHMPRELAQTGELHVSRRGALKMSGHLFKLRVDVNLTSDVLDTPDLFWNEASLQALYDAIREYLEMDDRIQTLNERLTIANELLEIIHEHLSNAAMSKITWIIIVLIVVGTYGLLTQRALWPSAKSRRV